MTVPNRLHFATRTIHGGQSPDPLTGMIGAYEGQPAADIDEVVYGGHYRDRP